MMKRLMQLSRLARKQYDADSLMRKESEEDTMRQNGLQTSGPGNFEFDQSFTLCCCVDIKNKSLQISVFIRFITYKMVILLGSKI